MQQEHYAAARLSYAQAMNTACRDLTGAALCEAVGKAADELTIAVAAAAIVGAVEANPRISIESMEDDLRFGDISGWLSLPAVTCCNLSEWSAAMSRAISDILDMRADVIAYCEGEDRSNRRLMG